MTRLRSFLVPAAALLALTASAQSGQGAAAGVNLVTASGSAEAKNAADMATLRIGVTSLAKTAKEAQATTSALANRLIQAALAVVPDRKAYQTSDLSLNPEYSNPPFAPGGFGGETTPPQGPKLVGYRATNVLIVRVDDVSKVGALVDAVTQAGATNVDSIAFGLKDDKAARRQALIDAVKEARAKAEAMAEGLGLRLGDVYSVEESGAIVRPFEMANVARFKGADTPVMPGEVTVGANVTVRFRLVK